MICASIGLHRHALTNQPLTSRIQNVRQRVLLKSLVISSLLDPCLNQKLFWQHHLADRPEALICAPRSEERVRRSEERSSRSIEQDTRESPSSAIGYKNSTSTAGAFEQDGGGAIQV